MSILLNNTTPEQTQEIKSLILSRVKRPLGSGATAKVYDFPQTSKLYGKWVLRKQKFTINFDQALERYTEWMKFCVNNPSPHVPEFVFCSLDKCLKTSRVKSLYVVMEKLHPLYHIVGEHQDIWDLDDEVTSLDEYVRGEVSWENVGINKFAGEKVVDGRSLRSIRIKTRKCGLELNDIHVDNVMFRASNRKIVITDPVV